MFRHKSVSLQSITTSTLRVRQVTRVCKSMIEVCKQFSALICRLSVSATTESQTGVQMMGLHIQDVKAIYVSKQV